MLNPTSGFFSGFQDVWMLDGVRTPMVDYCGALGGEIGRAHV